MIGQKQKDRIKAKTRELRTVVAKAKEVGIISNQNNTSDFFGQFDDRDPPPFSNFSNSPPPWGKA